jgi:hypothetical protein
VNPWLYRYAVLVGTGTFLTLVIGAWETSVRAAPGASYSGIASVHFALGIAVAALTAILSLWLLKTGLRALGFLCLAAVIAEAALGQTNAVVTHAAVAQILFALTIAAAVCTSSAWGRGPEIVLDQGWPSLRSLSTITPVFVVAQVLAGAAFRHKEMGLTWHIVGAMVVSLLVLILGMFVMQQFPKHPTLRPAAITMLTVALFQVLLGITAVTAEMMVPDSAMPPVVMLSTAAHVCGGAFTLASSLAMAIQIRRNVQKAAEEPEEESPSAANA